MLIMYTIELLAMEFENKILVATGCSHTYGNYLGQPDGIECHQRSWVKKLEIKGKFLKSDNIAIGGGSNQRSFRVTKEYILSNIDILDNIVVIIGLTEPSRFELPSVQNTPLRDVTFKGNYYMNKFGSWHIQNDNGNIQNFIDQYYSTFCVDEHVKHTLFLDILSMHFFLKSLQVKHYFFCFLIDNNYFNGYDLTNIPIYDFHGEPAITYAKKNGFKVGRDINPQIDCNHLDHDGNEFLADYMLNLIRSTGNGI